MGLSPDRFFIASGNKKHGEEVKVMIVIDVEEMAEFIKEELKKQNTVADKQYILKILNLEEEFLRKKGLIQD